MTSSGLPSYALAGGFRTRCVTEPDVRVVKLMAQPGFSQIGQSSVAFIMMVSFFCSLLLFPKHRSSIRRRWIPPVLFGATLFAGGILLLFPRR